MKSETQLTARLARAANKMSWICWNFHGNATSIRGIPDTFWACPYGFLFIEFKGPTTRIPAHQKQVYELLKKFGVPVAIVRFLEQEGNRWVFESNGRKLEITDTDTKVCIGLIKWLVTHKIKP